MRDHPCFCVLCRVKKYEECTQKHTVGQWKAINMTMKPIPKVCDSVVPSLHAVIKFFEGLTLQNDTTVIVGLVMTNKETNI